MTLYQIHRKPGGPNPLPPIYVLADSFQDALEAFHATHGQIEVAGVAVAGERPVLSNKIRTEVWSEFGRAHPEKVEAPA